MSSTAKNTVAIIVTVVVVGVVAYFIYSGSRPGGYFSDMGSMSGATSTVAGTSGQGTPTGTPMGNQLNPASNDNRVLAMLIGSAQVRVPATGVDVALSRGGADFTNGSSVQGHVNSGPIIGKVQTTDGYDVFTDMVVNMGSSTTMTHYVALFHTSGNAVKFTSAVNIGNGIIISNVVPSINKAVTQPSTNSTVMDSVAGYTLTVNYLDRKNGEPSTAVPTVAKTLTFGVKGHIISQ